MQGESRLAHPMAFGLCLLGSQRCFDSGSGSWTSELTAKSRLTTIQASVRTGISKTKLARWRRDGRGPVFVTRGGRIEYPARELEVWLRAWRKEHAAGELWGPE